jgi:hypothetical protein
MYRHGELSGGGQGPQTGLHGFAADLLDRGKPSREVVERLVGMGLDREAATAIVRGRQDDQWRHDGGGGPALQRVGPKHMLMGLGLALVGAAVTAVSIHYALDLGHSARIAYGAVAFGAMQFLYGLMRFLGG